MKINFKKRINLNQGITLIALVITIIVLLILAGVTLGLVFNSDGIFKKASAGASKYSQKQAEEILFLTLQEAQMKKYVEGLTDEQLDKMINKIGKVDESNKSLITVDKYIFEIDRTVPKILQFKGESDNIEHGTGGSEDSNTEDNKTPKVEIIEMTLTTDGMTMKFGAIGSSNTSQIDYFNYLITPSEGIAENKSIGTFKPDKTVEITSSKTEKYTITVTATDKLGNTTPIGNAKKLSVITNGGVVTPTPSPTPSPTTTPTLPELGEEPPEEGWTVEEAKGLVERDGLQEHLGEKVQYNPEQDPTGEYRIFYYDNEINSEDSSKGYFGDPLGTLYLKRNWDDKEYRTLGAWTSYVADVNGYNGYKGLDIMKQMNPLWAKSDQGEEVNLQSEHCVQWLCDPTIWSKYCDANYAAYAIGCTSIEMYIKSYNTFAGNNNALICDIGNTNGYVVGKEGTFINAYPYPSKLTITMEEHRTLFSNNVKCILLLDVLSIGYR